MSKGKVLITGGAGFIGSHMADVFLAQGFEVRVLDCLVPQVYHAQQLDANGWPVYLNADVERMYGNVLDIDTVRHALQGIDYVVHMAASVGVGQSMTNILDYTRNNEVGAAVLLQVLSERKHTVRRMAVASSISIYGEGSARRPSTGEIIVPEMRPSDQLLRRDWGVYQNGELLEPVPTPESKPLVPGSIYAVNKMVHELDFLIMGRALGIPTAAMRMFNVYGTRQALSNPYTGVAAIFISRLKNNQPPMIYEDGEQRRNFVHVHDVARAYVDFMLSEATIFDTFNVGSPEVVTIGGLARDIALTMGKTIEPEFTGKYRVGDIRHCYPDLRKIESVLGWRAEITLQQGLPELIEWADGEVAVDLTGASNQVLTESGLLV